MVKYYKVECPICGKILRFKDDGISVLFDKENSGKCKDKFTWVYPNSCNTVTVIFDQKYVIVADPETTEEKEEGCVLPKDEELHILELDIISAFEAKTILSYKIVMDYHIHDIWHELDSLIISLEEALEEARAMMDRLGHQHD